MRMHAGLFSTTFGRCTRNFEGTIHQGNHPLPSTGGMNAKHCMYIWPSECTGAISRFILFRFLSFALYLSRWGVLFRLCAGSSMHGGPLSCLGQSLNLLGIKRGFLCMEQASTDWGCHLESKDLSVSLDGSRLAPAPAHMSGN